MVVATNAQKPNCDTICLQIYSPICAVAKDDPTHNKVFGNDCLYKNANCEENDSKFKLKYLLYFVYDNNIVCIIFFTEWAIDDLAKCNL